MLFQDPYVHQAVKDGYRCRSAYKLLEIDDKFHFLTPGFRVVCYILACPMIGIPAGYLSCQSNALCFTEVFMT